MKKSAKGKFYDGFLTTSHNYKLVEIRFHSTEKMGNDTSILFSDKITKQNNKANLNFYFSFTFSRKN